MAAPTTIITSKKYQPTTTKYKQFTSGVSKYTQKKIFAEVSF